MRQREALGRGVFGGKGRWGSPSLVDVVAPKKSLECNEGSAEDGAMSGKTENM